MVSSEQEFEYEGFKSGADHYLGERANSRSSLPSYRDDDVNYENLITKSKTLQEHLISQVGEIQFDEKERAIAYKIIGNIQTMGILI